MPLYRVKECVPAFIINEGTVYADNKEEAISKKDKIKNWKLAADTELTNESYGMEYKADLDPMHELTEFYVEHLHTPKNSDEFKEAEYSRHFKTENEAINHAYQFQDGDSIVRIIGRSLLYSKIIASINLSKKFSWGG